MRRITPLVAVAALVLLSAGCSDDIICPELQETPYISALVVQRSDGEGESTHVEVVCTADPVPAGFAAVVNGEVLPVVVRPDGLGYLATLEADEVLWPPGNSCLLQVSADHGQAGATVFVPDAPAVTAPAEIFLGGELELLWESVTDADYYIVSAVLVTDEGARVHGAPAGWDTLVITRETSALFSSETFSSPGVVSGFVETVAGPFPESGAAGNISGDGWGFFTLRYRDSGSVFEVIVSDVP